MTRGARVLLGTTGAISVSTAVNRMDLLPTRLLAGSPQALADGRIWLLGTSALIADRPAVASLAGFAVVGLAALALCGSRVVWLAAVMGHVGSALLVYAAIVLARLAEPAAYQSVFASSDYGTSAVIAAWIGALAYRLWAGEAKLLAATLCVASGVIGWLFKNELTVLDAEHAVALCCGIVAMRYGSRLARQTVALDRLRDSAFRRLYAFGSKSTAITWPSASRSESGPGT